MYISGDFILIFFLLYLFFTWIERDSDYKPTTIDEYCDNEEL
jgi:hypothetical protein